MAAGIKSKRNEAAWAKSPDALIDAAVEDAKGAMQSQRYGGGDYPKNRKVYNMTQTFPSEEEFFTYAGSALNYWTAESNQEHMCNVFSIRFSDGTREYFAGPVYAGEENNVIIP